eukprot:GFUD01005740.1.p1 GENE.GFUD01005740.1~~GFUD01005740.1.p1  ORF type:complete len:152 (+),score=45.39 GFUD01005740.1:42-458(+)
MSFSRSNKVTTNQGSFRSPGYLEASVSKSDAEKMMWSLWTMGEDGESQDETDFKLAGKERSHTMSFSPRWKEGEDKKMVRGSTGADGFCMFNNQKGGARDCQDRKGSTGESVSWGTAASFGSQGLQRKNSETIFNFED